MINLDSAHWSELQDAYGPATKIPGLLKELRLHPEPKKKTEDEPWFSLWSALYHQGDIYTASYAAVPHIIKIGNEASGDIDQSFFGLPKEIVTTLLQGKGPAISDELRTALFTSLPNLLKIKKSFKQKYVLEDDGTATIYNKDGLCKQCGHIANPHFIISTQADRKGGVMLCPEEGCMCFMTWGFQPKE